MRAFVLLALLSGCASQMQLTMTCSPGHPLKPVIVVQADIEPGVTAFVVEPVITHPSQQLSCRVELREP